MALDLQDELFAQLGSIFTGEELFDCLPDLVFFIKNRRGEYVVVNRTLVERCGRRAKGEILGKRADEVHPRPLGRSYWAQDETVLRTGEPVLDQLELHIYPDGGAGWCLTNKLPLRDRRGRVVGLVGVSKDLHVPDRKGREYSRIAGAVRRIQTSFDEALKVPDLAAMTGLSVYQFEQRMRRIFGLTVGQFIQKVRMDAAVRHLRETDRAIAEVAQACSYSDQSAFSRQFRQTVGLSPAEYRRVSRRRTGGGTAGSAD